ncbi:uncharacterized protein DDB_G0283697-like [Bicyclus anynana]|uniref:Uncharacterized protein DDB_G0283697-like n=1 Tax=Bicyclus anynana TaxID=110368 RepID=A0ABM3LLL7_BICAN|nr:uncharacterized protein DDB_G0283697-like [Bicyclus anynana]
MTDAYNFNGTATHNNQTDRICNNMNGTCASNKTSNADSLDNLNNFTVSSNSTVKDLLCSYRENNTHCTNEAFDQSKSIFKQIEVNTTSKTDYKKSDELKGHFKNSLKRKRRSFNRNNDDDGDDDDKTVIPRVYDVIKDQNIERDELNLPKFSPSDIIKSSDLPDFKVPASHKSDKPDHNQFQRKEQRYPSPINNDQYFARGRSTNKQNKSYQQNKREFNPTTQKERYYDKINNEHYLPKTREITEESAEINVRQNPNIENSSYEDERGDISDNNNNKNEREHHNKVPTNILPRGNLRYHKEKKNKYHISKAKKINDESKENNNKNNASFEEDDEDDDDDVQDERFEDDDTATNKPKSTQGRKEEYNEDIIKQKGKDNFSYEEDEEPDTDFIRNKNIHGHKLLPNNSLHGNNEKYNDNHKNPSHTSKKPDEYNDEYDETEDDYKDDVDEKEPLKEFKSGSSFQTHKPSDDAILERHNQEYNDKRNKHFATVLKKEDDNNDDNYDDDDEDDDEDSIEHSKNNSKIDSHKQPPHNISPKQNELYNNKNENNKYYSPEHKNLDESNERQDTYNNHYQNKENVDQPIENDSGIHENKQISNKIQRQHELYNVDKNKYPVLNSKNRDDQSDENYETQGKSKESEYEEDIKDFPKKYSKNEELPTNTAAVPLHSYKTADFRKERKEHESKENEETYAPVKISHQNYEADSLIQPTVRPKINKKLKNKTANNRKPKVNKQVLNRGVAKSVIESNNENSSEESNENSNEKLTGNLNSIVPSHGNHRRINPNKTIRKPKVKKQFQTKPLNQADSNASKKDSLTNSESEGTLDILSPKTNKYDEHLKIKFDDINIKLPEIKLPQNILSYAQEVPDTNNDKVKNNYYNQQNHDLAQYKQNPNPQGETGNSYRHYDPTATTVYSQQPKAKGDKPAEEYDFFASYINKPNEEIKTDEDTSNSDIEDGEDLYERFVRERFGRKDSFKERTEKLQEKKAQENKSTTKNKELFDNIQKAIKKAEEVQQEAEKSKDPKANYLWTLEYGEKV